jgi:hypothetical protein
VVQGDAADTINDVIGFAPERDDLSGCHTDGDARQPSAESAIGAPTIMATRPNRDRW